MELLSKKTNHFLLPEWDWIDLLIQTNLESTWHKLYKTISDNHPTKYLGKNLKKKRKKKNLQMTLTQAP